MVKKPIVINFNVLPAYEGISSLGTLNEFEIPAAPVRDQSRE
ncbi:MAG: hypothetical protein R8G66_04560 [Cytophagales bacterium]|nr:hypothetical protein [Cytophagales bacterium]